MTNEEIWKAVLGEMELSLSRANFTTWFKNTLIVSKDINTVMVSVPNGFVKEWLENKFNKQILHSMRKLTPDVREVKYVIGQPKPDPAKQDISKMIMDKELEEQTTSSLSQDIDKNTNLNKKYTFDSFVVGAHNNLAHSASLAVAKNPGRHFNPMCIYGGVGLGKTHLVQAIGNYLLDQSKDLKVLYTSGEKITTAIIERIQSKTIEELKNIYSRLDVLIVDDVQYLSGKERTVDVFFQVFNDLYGRNKQIILTSDRPTQTIPGIPDRLQSRFAGGMLADIQAPDIETRLAILKVKCTEKGYIVSDEILSYIAEHIQKNIRELEGALNRVMAFAQIYNKTPEIKEVKNILNTYLAAPYRKTSPQTVLKSVADYYTVSLNDLTKRSRKKEVVKPRQVAMFLLREEIKLSFPEIGQKLGGRDHSTVIHACEKIKKEELADEQLKQELIMIKERIYNSFDK